MILVNVRFYLCSKCGVAVLEQIFFEFLILWLFININSQYFTSVFPALASFRLARTYNARFYLPLDWATISCTVRQYEGFAIACLRLYGYFLLYRWLNVSWSFFRCTNVASFTYPLKGDVFAQTSSPPVQRLTVISFPTENPLHLEWVYFLFIRFKVKGLLISKIQFPCSVLRSRIRCRRCSELSRIWCALDPSSPVPSGMSSML